MESVITLKDVRYGYKSRYQNVRALNGIDYSFQRGVFYAIVGASGSGKTTLPSLIAGLDIPFSGAVMINDTDIDGIDRDRYRLEHVSVIYQNLNLLPLLTALDNVMFPLEYKKIPEAEARGIAVEKLAGVGIDASKHGRLPSMLYGGEQQRVAIARALANGAEVILADEPTGNLDSENSMFIVRLLKKLTAAGDVTVIVVTHDMDVANEADVVIRINDGLVM